MPTFIPAIGRSVTTPLDNTRCPLCFEKIDLGRCDIVDIDDPTKIIEKADTGIARRLPKKLQGARFLNARRQCYLCGNLLPLDIECMDGNVIGLVGAQAAGKSHFVAALIREITLGGALDGINISVEAADHLYEKRYQDDYYHTLFNTKSAIPATESVSNQPDKFVEPLIYSMIYRTEPKGPVVQRATLYLFDSSGEDQRDPKSIALWNKYIYNASALIFLIDPFSIERIRDSIAEPFKPKDLPRQNGYQKLQDAIAIIRQFKGLQSGQTIPIPAAIILAKSDVLKYVVTSLMKVAPNQCEFLRKPDYDSSTSLAQSFRSVDAEVRDLIREADGQGILKLAQTFQPVQFFAASATGCPVDKLTMTFQKVEPVRCADPLIWLLWQMHIAPEPTP